MFRCLNCNVEFEKPEFYIEHHNGIQEPGEKISCCPVCKNDYLEIFQCKCCEKYFFEDELYDKSYCKDCLLKQIDYDVFWQYLVSDEAHSDQIGKLEDFFFQMVWNIAPPKQTSFELKAEIKEIYKRRIALDKLCKHRYFLDTIIDYLQNDLDDFAEWLNGEKIDRGGLDHE